MAKVNRPQDMNEAFASAFNSGALQNLLDLYEPDAVLRTDAESTFVGKAAIGNALAGLLGVPGRIEGRNNFCLEFGDVALLRADWRLIAPDGGIVMEGASAEIVRRQADGTWLYIVDHASGGSVPAIL